jgi:hypothetical protein
MTINRRRIVVNESLVQDESLMQGRPAKRLTALAALAALALAALVALAALALAALAPILCGRRCCSIIRIVREWVLLPAQVAAVDHEYLQKGGDG